MTPSRLLLACLALACLTAPAAPADVLELKDGTVLLDCYTRDDALHFTVWDSLDKVGTPEYRVIPRSQVANRLSARYQTVLDGEEQRFNVQPNPIVLRGAQWDEKPPLPDLTITFIEMNPKLAGLHGLVPYDNAGRPSLGGAPALDKRRAELEAQGKDPYLNPEYIAQDLKFAYEPGEMITFTAHVRNMGFADSRPFEFRWLIDDEQVARGSWDRPIKEMGEATFEHPYAWQEGRHTIGFEILTDQQEIATINNKATDAMWAFSYFYIVNPRRAQGWHDLGRTAYGTFSWEDFYRWHLDIMNLLFENSVYPSAPNGVEARVRLDKIYYLDFVDGDSVRKARVGDDGVGYDQGGWIWNDSPDARETGKWVNSDRAWRNRTEWSLPHELGHQLGIVDYYALDYAGHEDHLWPDNGEKIAHFQNHPATMMHWHGPHLWSETSAMYLNSTIDKPRGYFGDHYFAIPDECFLRIVDVNGKGLPDAQVELFQRGAAVDPAGKPHDQEGVTWYDVIEDGDYGKPVSKEPVIAGRADKDGVLRLPNRDVLEVKTFNGFHRKPNPFGNINVVGGRGLMLVKVVKDGAPAWFWLEAIDYNLAWYSGHADSYTVTLETPFASADSPRPPVNVRWQYADRTKKTARVVWQAPNPREQHPKETPIGYRVYRRRGPMGLNDRPWYPVATLNRDATEFVVDLDEMYVNDVEWFTHSDRFAVSALAALNVESGLVQARDENPKEEK